MPGEQGAFIFRPLDADDKVNRFEIDHVNDGLRAFLKKDAGKFHLGNISKTYVAVDAVGDHPKRVRAYISILNSEIAREMADELPEAGRYPSYPAIKIARLATDRNYERKGLASGLIDLAVGIARERIMPHSGCRFLILDANRDQIGFYSRRGFTMVNSEENQHSQNPVMFLDLHKLANV